MASIKKWLPTMALGKMRLSTSPKGQKMAWIVLIQPFTGAP
jgi:hypothetical protein